MLVLERAGIGSNNNQASNPISLYTFCKTIYKIDDLSLESNTDLEVLLHAVYVSEYDSISTSSGVKINSNEILQQTQQDVVDRVVQRLVCDKRTDSNVLCLGM